MHGSYWVHNLISMYGMNSIKKKLRTRNQTRFMTAVLVILLIVVAGVHLLVSSHAASPYVPSQADSGTLTPPATIQTCPGSTDGTCVQFGTTPLAAHITGGQLVNGQDTPLRLLGVDASGTEDACIQNKGISWGFANTEAQDAASAAAMQAWHINTVRVQLNEDCWLGINDSGINPAYVGANYQAAIKNWVTALNAAGIYTILDLHWAAPGTNPAAQQWPMADEDHAPTFWTQVATAYKSDPAVIYDPFNEPFMGTESPAATDWSCWLNGCSTSFTPTGATSPITYTTAGMQQLVNTIRATGALQPIMIGGLNWAGDPCGLKNAAGSVGSETNCTEIANMPTDSAHQLALSFHTYNWTACATSSCWNSVATAAKAANLPVITGEFGERDCTTSYMDSYMKWADGNNISYVLSFWDTFYSATGNYVCTVGDPTSNTDLISSYATGAPSTIAPYAGTDYKAHLLSINP
jgi:endoglucanase